MTRTIRRRPNAEVCWYLESRGIPLPVALPALPETPPKGVLFDPERVDHVLQVFSHLRVKLDAEQVAVLAFAVGFSR